MLHTRLTELLECDHPVMLAGMGGVAYAELVAAVSEAGGFGTLGAAPMSLALMTVEITAIRQRTERPFGVDLLTALPDGMHAQVEAVIHEGHLLIAGQRTMPAELRTATIHRLELPQGRFERRIPLPAGRYDAVRRASVDGCLLISLRKAA